MDISEKLAFENLTSNGYSQIVYEPDGKVPPDFLIEGKIAVEVRRLNYNKITATGEYQGIENAQRALLPMMRETLTAFGNSKDGNGSGWWVHYRFSRPLPRLATLRRRIRDILQAFSLGLIELEENELQVTERFFLRLIPCTTPRPQCFSLAGFTDRDTTGWLGALLEENIRICVAEKTRKIASVRFNYPIWWLMLIDHVGYGSRESIQIEHNWDKILIVNSLNPQSAYEL